MFHKPFIIGLLALALQACEAEDTAAPTINCNAGTALNRAGDACEPNLAEGLSVSANGQIVVDPAGVEATEAALAAAREEGHAAGVASVDISSDNQAAFDEGAASVTPLECSDGTVVNEAGDACEPTADYRAARLAEGAASVTPLNCAEGTRINDAGDACEPTDDYRAARFAEGAASVTPLNCAEGTRINDAGEACEPTEEFRAAAFAAGRAEGAASVTPLSCGEGTEETADGTACQPTEAYRAAAVEEGRAEGVDSVIPLECGLGTGENEAGDACEPNLSVDVAIDDEDTIVPTSAYAAQVCADGGGTFDAGTGACAPAYNCFRGGLCAVMAVAFGFEAEEGNRYDGDTLENSGCLESEATRAEWVAGTLGVAGRQVCGRNLCEFEVFCVGD